MAQGKENSEETLSRKQLLHLPCALLGMPCFQQPLALPHNGYSLDYLGVWGVEGTALGYLAQAHFPRGVPVEVPRCVPTLGAAEEGCHLMLH